MAKNQTLQIGKIISNLRSPQALAADLFLRRHVKKGGLRGNIQLLRRNFKRLDNLFPRPLGLQRKQIAGVECDFVPGKHPNKVLLWLHGGGFVVSFKRTHAFMAWRVGRRFGAEVILPDYRLAPEYPYPAGADDCFEVYKQLVESGKEIVLGGDSAGGNFVLGLALRARDQGLPLPKCLVLISTVVDLNMGSLSLFENQDTDPVFERQALVDILDWYCPEDRRKEILASPILGDPQGLPPMFFQVSTTEMLRDETLRFADKAKSSGVSVEVELWKKLPHVFQAMWFLPEASRAIRHIRRFIHANTKWKSDKLFKA